MKRLALVLAWVLATFATALVAWSAVRLAGDQVGERPVEPLSAAEVAALPASTLPTTAAVDGLTGTVTTTGVTTTTPATATTATTATTTAASPATTAPAATSTTRPPAPASSSTTSPFTTSTTATTTTVPPATAPETLAYQLEGGWVVIEASPGRVVLRSASPKPGYAMEVKSAGPEEVRVEFEGEHSDSEFRARWSEGGLDVDISD